jgi:protein TonB
VIVKVLVGPDGQVANVQILRGSRKDPGFDSAALTAVRQWAFAPAQRRGQPIASWFNVGVPFQLKR